MELQQANSLLGMGNDIDMYKIVITDPAVPIQDTISSPAAKALMMMATGAEPGS